jgi:hypothetical protein
LRTVHLGELEVAEEADEVATALRVAEAFGYLAGAEAVASLGFCDRVLAMLWRLTR